MATSTEHLSDAHPLAAVHVRDAMRPGVLTATADASIGAVARIMAVHQVHAVVLRGAAGDAPGDSRRVVTDLDLVRAAVEAGAVATAAAAASSSAPAISADATLRDAAVLMTGRAADHVVVTREASPAPVGMLSSFDLVTVLAHGTPAVARLARPAAARSARSAADLAGVPIRAVMHAGIIASPPDATLAEVAAVMAAHRVHAVAIERPGLVLPAFVTTMDVVGAAPSWDPGARAADLAAVDVVTVDDRDTLDAAARLMVERGVARVVTVDGEGRPSGLVSTLDVAAVVGVTGG